MKPFYFLLSLSLFFISSKLTAQQTTFIPDNNFEQALIDLGYDDALDDYVFTNTISTVTDLDIKFKAISDLTGIASFTALRYLNCAFNNLISLDLSKNTALTYLDCGFNKLDVLDVSSNKVLTVLYCDYNNLVDLNVNNGNNTNFTIFDASSNSGLNCIDVDNAAYSAANWPNKDATSSYCDDGAPAPPVELTFVPDDNFEKALIALGYDTTLDDYVPTNSISRVTSLDVSNRGIADLTGLENFSDLIKLECFANQITSLDISQNKALRELNCRANQLTSLDLSNNLSLFYLNTSANSLSSLDISQNTELSILYAQINQLTRLNARNGNNTNITAFNTTSNPSLNCIEVDDAAYSNSNWLNKDATASYCDGRDTTELTFVPDTNFEQALINKGFDDILDDYVLTSNISGITFLDVSGRGIADLTGIESFSSLTVLYCRNNELSSLDVSNNVSLIYLNLTSNNLSSLDVSNNLLLTRFYCPDNNLVSLNVKNGNNTSFTNFDVRNNPDLACIEVDDAAYSAGNWINKDAASSYSINCGYAELTFIPDTNFEKALVEFGYDDVLDGYVLTSNINSGVTFLVLDNRGIKDLTGIEAFSDLAVLYSRNNELTSLDVSNNTALNYLNLTSNNLFSLDVSNNLLLTRFYCPDNNLVSLNIKNGNNTSFTNFDVRNNPDLACIAVDNATYSTSNWLNKDPASSYSANCGTSTAKSSNTKDESYTYSSTEQSEITNYKLYPNPVKDVLNISIGHGDKMKQVNFYNAYGQRVLSAQTSRINVNNLQSGIYFVEIETNQGKATKKIIVQ